MPRANRDIAEMCIEHAWRDDTDDRSRWLLELAAKRIRRLGRRCISLSHQLETAEGDVGELLFELQELEKCRYRTNWRIRLGSCIYGGLAFVFAILQPSLAAVSAQLKMLADNCRFCIQMPITWATSRLRRLLQRRR